MFTQIFDTHSHYMDDAFVEDRDAVLQALPEGGVALAMLASSTPFSPERRWRTVPPASH